jgi:urea transport system ATP-binding protein
MLTVSALNQYYGGSHILRDLSFEVPLGRVTVLLGRNGVGKTTLLKTLMGLVPARSGRIQFETRDITRAAPYLRARYGMGYVPQGREIFPRLTVEENLQMGLATNKHGRNIPEQIFELFPVLKTMLHRRGGDLSGGQQQQLAIGRALALNPYLLIRRAHRRDPAFDHQGHRERDPHACEAGPHGDPARRAVLRLRALARRSIPADGARRNRAARQRRGHGS